MFIVTIERPDAETRSYPSVSEGNTLRLIEALLADMKKGNSKQQLRVAFQPSHNMRPMPASRGIYAAPS